LSVGADAEAQVVVGRRRSIAALGEDLCALTVSASDLVPREVGADLEAMCQSGTTASITQIV